MLGKTLLSLMLNLCFTAPFPPHVAEAAFCKGSDGEHLLVGPLPGHSTLALCKEPRARPLKKSALGLDVLMCTQEWCGYKDLNIES